MTFQGPLPKGDYKNGYPWEKIYEVVWSDEDKRQPGASGKVPAVSLANATIGRRRSREMM